MERTPYVETGHGSSAVMVYSDRFATNKHRNVVKSYKPISLKVNIGELLCDMIFGSDWNIHLKHYLSLLECETFLRQRRLFKESTKKTIVGQA